MKTADFQLDLPQLRDVQAALVARIEEGLAHDGRQIKALPAFLTPPLANLRGLALAIDTGGTNLRAAVVEVTPESTRLIEGPIGAVVPDGRDGHKVDRAAFFGAHTEVVRQLASARGLPIGFCFSYPSAVEPDRDARLLGWTKGLHVEGMVGTRVGAGLVEALAQAGLEPGPVTVLNDTVASLLAASSLSAAPERAIGLIVGTGHNLASFFPGHSISKLGQASDAPMAVNLESGNFHPPHLTPADERVDAASDNLGKQRMEKATSGFYLPQIFAAARPSRVDDATRSAKALHALAYEDTSDPDSELARALFERSADLVAAALAGIGTFHGPGAPITVLGEGSVYRSHPRYAERIARRLVELGGHFVLRSREDANLCGAAWAALSPR